MLIGHAAAHTLSRMERISRTFSTWVSTRKRDASPVASELCSKALTIVSTMANGLAGGGLMMEVIAMPRFSLEDVRHGVGFVASLQMSLSVFIWSDGRVGY